MQVRQQTNNKLSPNFEVSASTYSVELESSFRTRVCVLRLQNGQSTHADSSESRSNGVTVWTGAGTGTMGGSSGAMVIGNWGWNLSGLFWFWSANTAEFGSWNVYWSHTGLVAEVKARNWTGFGFPGVAAVVPCFVWSVLKGGINSDGKSVRTGCFKGEH